MSKRVICALLAVMAAVLVFGGCSNSRNDAAVPQEAGPYMAEPGAPFTTTAGSARYYSVNDSANGGSGEVSAAPDAGGAPAGYEKVVIRNARLSLSSEDAAGTYAQLLAFAKGSGGYEFSQSTVYNDRDGSVAVSAVIKIPPAGLDALLAQASLFGKVLNSSTSSQDITDSYYDTSIRLETMKRSLEKYYGFLASSANVSDMLSVQNQINSLTADIEAAEGKLRMWDALAAEATVTLSVTQPARDAAERRVINYSALSAGDMGYLLKTGFLGALSFIVKLFQWVIIIIVSALPVIVPLGTVLLVILLVHRRRKSKKKESKE